MLKQYQRLQENENNSRKLHFFRLSNFFVLFLSFSYILSVFLTFLKIFCSNLKFYFILHDTLLLIFFNYFHFPEIFDSLDIMQCYATRCDATLGDAMLTLRIFYRILFGFVRYCSLFQWIVLFMHDSLILLNYFHFTEIFDAFAMLCYAKRYSAMLCDTMRYDVTLDDAMLCQAMRCYARLYDTPHILQYFLWFYAIFFSFLVGYFIHA